MDDFDKLYNTAFIDNQRYLFDNNMCKIDVIEDIFTIKDEKSEMECRIKLSSKSICSSDIEGNKKFNHLRMNKCADAVIINKNKNGKFDLHIIELKNDIHDEDLKELHKQFLGAYLRIRSIFLAYSNDIENIKFYLVYKNNINSNNNLKQDNSTNKIKDNTNLRRLFKQNRIINNVLLKIYPFNFDALDIIKHDITYNNEIII
ncbi:hypothetical protein A966_12988 [Brachyspira hampsonii 30446]|uniref:Uncharacterized protein n=1 Tax=Brachyspira hampsonii 30446 TaxID=1289135 RepID=A0A2U4FFM3_9SPIR|nr:hypothetical protein [Brachyspira hampsonii]EKV55961.1 hypothetical protein A966_12988 [Brachyspira hampsonii 30446]OEJ19739.1 hypothetical protein A9495_03950 [Brachyspira hampsonii]